MSPARSGRPWTFQGTYGLHISFPKDGGRHSTSAFLLKTCADIFSTDKASKTACFQCFGKYRTFEVTCRLDGFRVNGRGLSFYKLRLMPHGDEGRRRSPVYKNSRRRSSAYETPAPRNGR